ncbi:MAG: Uncharacterized protein XD97_0097 [Pelotomaculum thermopropionicum]|uniref:Peptidase MA-like domain-containing protein n=1 Tax=Pelotomaculum thermopropionicum TaxID=110500 RepID=A0A101HVK4_9FIRM|nr:MAG: Uncharacterized protein XD97_0097 [Pelotomaculum thermopropionicum]
MKTVLHINRSQLYEQKHRDSFWVKLARVAAALLFLLPVWLGSIPAGIRFYSYWAIRELVKAHTVINTLNMSKLKSEHFYVKFKPGDRAAAELVLETAELFYPRVSEDFAFSARTKIPVIMYASREELNKSFGWDADNSAMGVYWAGTIRVLAPDVWIHEADSGGFRGRFIASGPMAHELTHLVVDYLTGGNYPRWFTEGVAQYEEYKLTGFKISAPVFSRGPALYSMQELAEKFDGLPDQSLAYWESLAAVRYLVYFYGEDALDDLIKELGRGLNFSAALKKVTRLDCAGFEKQWQEWAKNTGNFK